MVEVSLVLGDLCLQKFVVDELILATEVKFKLGVSDINKIYRKSPYWFRKPKMAGVFSKN